MKLFLFIGLLLGVSLSGLAQGRGQSTDELTKSFRFWVLNAEGNYIETELEQKPEYRTGYQQFFKDLYLNMRYPAQARKKSVQGTVYAEIYLNAFGQIEKTAITQDIGANCGDAVLAAMQGLDPMGFTPAYHEGKAVAVKFELPVRFRLH